MLRVEAAECEHLPAAHALRAFIDVEYPTCDGLLLFGSQATGTAGPDSDIDAFVILPHLERCYHELRQDDDFIFDLGVYELSGLRTAMHRQRRAGGAGFAMSLATGIVLRDRSGLLQQARAEARRIIDAPVAVSDWNSQRASLSALLSHVRRPRSEHQRIDCLNALYRLVTNVMLLQARRFLHSPTQTAEILDSIDPMASDSLHSSYQDAICGRAERFLQFTERQLDTIGGPIRINERRFVP